MPSFQDFSLQPSILTALANMHITETTPIQAGAIPALMAGQDLVGQSATGSGKTLAYGIPLVERLSKDKRQVQALVLVPTRELALQVNNVLNQVAANRRITTALLVGGRPYGPQLSALRYGAQIVVGTPGRVKDHLESGALVLNQLRICVLDEADQMLDSGFAPVIEDILTTTPPERQMALFSATMPDWVKKLQEKFLKDPVTIAITPATGGESTIEQIAYQVPQDKKMAALCTLLLSTEGESSLIFGRTKYGVEKLGEQLSKLGFVVETLHGNKSQNAREKVLTAFRRGQIHTLLATNVAARGLDIRGIAQVINYELPESSELFTHRIGRTGRMGQQGKAITLLVPSDVPKWRRMSHNLGQKVSLQKLEIDEQALVPRPQLKPATVVEEPRYEAPRYEAPRPIRSRDSKPFSPVHERARRTPVRHEGSSLSNAQRRQKGRVRAERSDYSPEWLLDNFAAFEEPTFAERGRNGRKNRSEQPEFGNRPVKHQARIAAPEEPRQRTGRRAPGGAPVPAARTRRIADSRRFANR